MDSALVIKVKYGDFLRRFIASVDENNQLDLDMIRLRAKIFSLFNIPADANFILRYVDEDGDLVTLLDDNDLCDVMRQSLKFLRIDVHMSNDNVGKSNARSNGNVAIDDAFKFVPYPLLKTLPNNLSNDFVSKATFADYVSKMGPSSLFAECPFTGTKLDSWLILDVNLIDRTIMAPSTAFTKIWRMKNIGTSVWPKGTQLVWIGGNMLVDSQSFDLEIPEDGVPVDNVLDIAVILRAPKLPGQYFSYWRMAYPSCQYFGQSISVLIQVEATPNDSFYDVSQGLNLNIPPADDSDYKGSQVPDINVKPIIDEVFLQPHNYTSPTEPVKQKVDEQLKLQQENNFPIKPTIEGHSTSSPATSVAEDYDYILIIYIILFIILILIISYYYISK